MSLRPIQDPETPKEGNKGLVSCSWHGSEARVACSVTFPVQFPDPSHTRPCAQTHCLAPSGCCRLASFYVFCPDPISHLIETPCSSRRTCCTSTFRLCPVIHALNPSKSYTSQPDTFIFSCRSIHCRSSRYQRSRPSKSRQKPKCRSRKPRLKVPKSSPFARH